MNRMSPLAAVAAAVPSQQYMATLPHTTIHRTAPHAEQKAGNAQLCCAVTVGGIWIHVYYV